MSQYATTASLSIARRPLGIAADTDRRAQRLVAAAWCLLWLNALSFAPGQSGLPIPSLLGKAITQLALMAAFFVALATNRRLVVRPNIVLALVSLMAIEAVLSGLEPQFAGTYYRIFRFAIFTITLWLLTPYWGRRDLPLVRCHVTVLSAVLGSVLLGLPTMPGAALANGRLGGAVWPIPPTQVAHYAAVLLGLVAVLWLAGRVRGIVAVGVIAIAGPMLLLTHTRTAMVALAAGLLIADLSLIASNARARRALITVSAAALIVGAAFSGLVTRWMTRGQDFTQLTEFTGRLLVWRALVSQPRDRFHEIFGFGLSNGSFNGLPIDSNWLSSYQQQGLFGVAACAVIAIVTCLRGALCRIAAPRAIALFLITYCVAASFTEDGFATPTAYLLDLIVAASVLVPPPPD
jgi:hypothetical protein